MGPEDEMRVGFGWGKDEGEGGLNALGSSGCGTMVGIGPASVEELYAGGGERAREGSPLTSA